MTDTDPRFQPARLTEADVRAALAALAERTGILRVDRADWMISGIIEGDASNMGAGPTITAWKNHDELLTVEEKRSLGINTRVKICRALADTLTEKGLADVNESLSAIFMAPIFARSRDNPKAGYTPEMIAATAGIEAYQQSQPQRLSAVTDTRTCAVALAAHGTVYPPGTAPALPLEGCDAISCRCTLLTWNDAMARRHAEPQAQTAPASPSPGVALKLGPQTTADSAPTLQTAGEKLNHDQKAALERVNAFNPVAAVLIVAFLLVVLLAALGVFSPLLS